ncbi:MAG: alpha/beta fold hydrolase [Anaerofustis sp.]
MTGKENEYWIQLKDAAIHARECGYGDCLILLHGNGEDSTYFDAQIRYFSRTHRVIALDTRGHGKSERGTAPFRFEQFAKDLCECMKVLKIRDAHMVGFSDGGNTAITFALRYPDRVKSLVLNGANLNPCGMKLFVLIGTFFEYCFCSAKGLFSKKIRMQKERLSLMIKQPHIIPSSLKQLHIPTLVIVGSNDMIRQKHSRLIASSIPDAEFSVIADADHFVAAKKPDQFNHTVENFLNRQNQ